MIDETEMSELTAHADTQCDLAWGLDYDDPDEFPTVSGTRLTPRRVTAIGVGASLLLMAGAGLVALWAAQPVAIVPPAVVVETTTTTTPPAPPPPPVTVQAPAPTTPGSASNLLGTSCDPGNHLIITSETGVQMVCAYGTWVDNGSLISTPVTTTVQVPVVEDDGQTGVPYNPTRYAPCWPHDLRTADGLVCDQQESGQWIWVGPGEY